jgi:hypothetical protein
VKLGDLFSTNPKDLQLLNNGVAFVKDVVTPEELKTLRFELRTFVCEGEYAKGLEKILRTYLSNLDRPEQPSVWVSGFTAPANPTWAKSFATFGTISSSPKTKHGRGALPICLRKLRTSSRS